jgi:hypothetical protein
MTDDVRTAEKCVRVRVGTRIYHAVDHVPPEGEESAYRRGEVIAIHKSLNSAKRDSRVWQQSTGKLGDGRLRVAAKAPPRDAT